MRLDTKALGFTFGIVWGGAILLVGMANLIWHDYGSSFLELGASLYPGYAATSSFGQVVIGTLYGFVDGIIGGVVFAWIYNVLVPAPTT
jgi:hypothetical protein